MLDEDNEFDIKLISEKKDHPKQAPVVGNVGNLKGKLSIDKDSGKYRGRDPKSGYNDNKLQEKQQHNNQGFNAGSGNYNNDKKNRHPQKERRVNNRGSGKG